MHNMTGRSPNELNEQALSVMRAECNLDVNANKAGIDQFASSV